MQSLYGKLRLVTKQTVNKIVSFESNFLGCSMNQSSRFDSHHSSPGSAFSWNKNYGTKIFSPASSKSYGIASALPYYGGLSSSLNQSASLASILPARNITTSGSTSQDVSDSCDVPRRIKFKRLDKTARHIMQGALYILNAYLKGDLYCSKSQVNFFIIELNFKIVDKEAVEEVKGNREIPEIKPGYIIQMKVEVPENKRRVTTIKGTVIARRNAGLNTTFRIRRLVAGVGIESLFPLYSPNIKEIIVLEKKKVRRAKLYYLRDRMKTLKKR
ncbi:hypothetical protein OROMI_003021 [Orobanche minor]